MMILNARASSRRRSYKVKTEYRLNEKSDLCSAGVLSHIGAGRKYVLQIPAMMIALSGKGVYHSAKPIIARENAHHIPRGDSAESQVLRGSSGTHHSPGVPRSARRCAVVFYVRHTAGRFFCAVLHTFAK